ncbi:MAG: polyhydroxyalkanoate synthesis regulator DNA-binding domain-containing protein [Candidatus Korobacteraceae bacterium]
MPQPLIIKKYENRRLYNTLTSQYINQDQVAQLVRDGYDVQVVDAASGEDITRFILAQIVLEDAKTPDSVFPLDVLRQMIVVSGKATQENALRYMKFMMEIYQNAYRAMPAPVSPFEMLAGRWARPPDGEAPPSGSASAPPGGRPTGSRQAGNDSNTVAGGEIAEMKERIAELEASLSRAKPRQKARATKSRRKA